DQTADQATGPTPQVFKLPPLDQAGEARQRLVQPLQSLDAGLLIDGDHQLALLKQVEGVQVQLADVQRLDLKSGIVAFEPIAAAVGLQVGRRQDALDSAAAHVLVV